MESLSFPPPLWPADVPSASPSLLTNSKDEFVSYYGTPLTPPSVPQIIVPRRDRPSLSPRPFVFRIGVNPSVTGSAYVQCGDTKVICAIVGPRSARRSAISDKGKFTVDFRFANFCWPRGATPQRRKYKGPTEEEKAVAQRIMEAFASSIKLEVYSKTVIECFVTVIQHDGSFLSAAINAVSMALTQGNFDMVDTVGAIEVAYINKEVAAKQLSQFNVHVDDEVESALPLGESEFKEAIREHLFVDPTYKEGRVAACSLVLGYMKGKGQISLMKMEGGFGLSFTLKGAEEVKEKLSLGAKGVEAMAETLRVAKDLAIMMYDEQKKYIAEEMQKAAKNKKQQQKEEKG